jgi:hypothetical protein
LSSFLATTPAVGEALQSPTPQAEKRIGFVFLLDSAFIRSKSQFANG